MTDSLRDRIAEVLGGHWAGASGSDCKCSWKTAPTRALSDDYEKHLADAVIAALGPIPDRSFTDDHGRTWEWCGGVPGTWAWRITNLGIAHD